MNDQTASVALLAVTSSVGVFTGLLPSLAETRKATGDPVVTNDVRMGEAAAAALTVGIGLMASSMVNSPVPMVLSVVAALGMVFMYESVLQATPKERKTT